MIATGLESEQIGINWDAEWGPYTERDFLEFLRNSRSRRVRSIQEFAEQEITLPTGPREGLKFDINTQPFAKLLWDEFDNPYWNEYAVTGSTQTGKSLLGFAIPVVHRVCEIQEDAIIAAPTKEILYDKVKRDIIPLIENTRYKDMWPLRGGGSKGGVPDLIELRNGSVLKLMSFEGGDKSKASFTCPNIYITEVDGERASLTSAEAKALEQIVARSRATARDRRFILYECTVTFEDGPIWQLVHHKGSGGRIMLQCPHCKAWSCPCRDNLKGWQEAESEIQAEKNTHWHCPECDKRWSEKQRYTANLNAKLIHKEQTIDKRGRVRGKLPETRTLGFRFAAVNSMFLPAGDIGVDCFYARENPDEIDAEKKLTQFVFCLPFEPPGYDKFHIDREVVEQRRMQYPQGHVPESSQWITIGVDVGKYRCHWVAIAWLIEENLRAGLIIDYGTVELLLMSKGKKLTAKELGFDQVFSPSMADWKKRVDTGWMQTGGELKSFDKLWIDARWQGEEDDPVVYDTIKRWGDPRVLPVMGHGQNNYNRRPYREPRINPRTGAIAQAVVESGGGGHYYHVAFVPELMMNRAHVDSDAWKLIVQNRIVTEKDKPGALMLFESKNPREHATIVKHWESETRERTFEPGKGLVEQWTVVREANHYLDATAYACAAGFAAGFRVQGPASSKQAKANQRSARIVAPGGRAFVASQR